MPTLFDTDVLIWYFRGLEQAMEVIDETPYDQRCVSSICIMELIQGCRNKRELKDVTDFFRENFSRVIHCNDTISERALMLLRTYALSHGLRTIDAIIAATAITSKASLVTGNRRHFAVIEKIPLIEFHPKARKKK